MSKVSSYDFSRYQNAMVSREGFSAEAAATSWRDLKILLCAMEREPSKPFALTVSADRALHGLLLDTIGCLQFGLTVFGPGQMLAHNPWVAPGMDEFATAWVNTRAAFAAEGIDLPEDPTAGYGENKADACIFGVHKAEACILGVQRAEACILGVTKAEACILGVVKAPDLQAA